MVAYWENHRRYNEVNPRRRVIVPFIGIRGRSP